MLYKNDKTEIGFAQKKLSNFLVSKYTTGNVTLQLGYFSTAVDIKKRREAVCHYNFVD